MSSVAVPAAVPARTSRSRALAPRLLLLPLLVLVMTGLVGPVASTPADAAVPRSGDVVALTATRAGMPYLYGAEGPTRFDCSGLVQWVYGRLGKALPRTSRDQFAATARIRKTSARNGDLVFFSSGGRIYHVGIYATGGYIWHAPKAGDVVRKAKIWTSSYYVNRVV